MDAWHATCNMRTGIRGRKKEQAQHLRTFGQAVDCNLYSGEISGSCIAFESIEADPPLQCQVPLPGIVV